MVEAGLPVDRMPEEKPAEDQAPAEEAAPAEGETPAEEEKKE